MELHTAFWRTARKKEKNPYREAPTGGIPTVDDCMYGGEGVEEEKKKEETSYKPSPKPTFERPRRTSFRIAAKKPDTTPTNTEKKNRKRSAEFEPETEHKKPKMSKQEAMLKSLMDSVQSLTENQLKKGEVASQVKKIVHDAIDEKVTTKFKALDKRNDKIEERLTKLENENRKPSKGRKRAKNEDEMSEEYLLAKRSLKLAPCNNSPEAVWEFMSKQLQLPEDVLKNMAVKSAREVFEKKLPSHRKKSTKPKLQIELHTVEDRDLILSYASNLKGAASIDIVIPDKLLVLAGKLDHYAYKVRQRSKEDSGGKKDLETKTQVRLDNKAESLVLGIRRGKGAKWEFYNRDNLPTLSDSEDEDGEGEGEDGEEDEEEEMEGFEQAND